jgi:outer membrane protein assembly factor BamB/orotate phosphoribosyltransferase
MNTSSSRGATNATARSLLLEKLRTSGVVTSDREPITGPNGRPARWLVDTREVLFSARFSEIVGDLMWDVISKLGPVQLACVEMTGIPLALVVQHAARRSERYVNVFVIRKERKATGRQRVIEGVMGPDPIVFVDDILNSGESIRRARSVLAQEQRRISRVVALIDFGRQMPGDALLDAGVSVTSIIALSELGLEFKGTEREEVPLITPKRLWSFRSVAQPSFDIVPKSTPLLRDERVCFGSDNGTYYAVDAARGELIWSRRTGTEGRKGIRSSAAAGDGALCFGAYNGMVYCLDVADGLTRWERSIADWVGSSPDYCETAGMFYVGTEHAHADNRGGLTALRATDGEVAWHFDIPSLVHGSPLAVQAHQVVCVGCNGGYLWIIDARDGRLRWSAKTGGAIKYRPTFDPATGLIIAGSFDGSIYAWHVESGSLAWKFDTEGYIYSTPLICDAGVYVTSSDKHVYLIDRADGKHIRKQYLGSRLLASPHLCDGRIYIPTTAGAIAVLDAQTCELLGRMITGERFANEVIVDLETRTLYAVTVDGTLVAYEQECFGGSPPGSHAS